MRRVICSTRGPRVNGTVFSFYPGCYVFKFVGIVSVLPEQSLVHSVVTYFSVAIVLESLIPTLDAEDLRSQQWEFHFNFEPS